MLRSTLVALAAVTLAASCADPLADIERLEDVPLAEDAPTAAAVATDAEPVDLVGLFGQIFPAPAAPEPEVSADPQLDLPVVPEDEAAEAEPVGFFDALGLNPTPATATVPQIAPGTVLPYGELATVCGLRARNLGRAVESVAGYTIYDSDPGNAAARTHFVTGFDDGCARQFSAALVLFGDVGTHEFLRYSPTHSGVPYSQTDLAYEAIKAQFCRVSSRQPCGNRLESLGRNTAFMTIYPRFGGSGGWFEVLLHGGNVAATGFEGAQ